MIFFSIKNIFFAINIFKNAMRNHMETCISYTDPATIQNAFERGSKTDPDPKHGLRSCLLFTALVS